MNVTGIELAEIKKAVKACRTVMLFQADSAPALCLEAVPDGLAFSARGSGAAARILIPGTTKTEGTASIDLKHFMQLHLAGKTASVKATKTQAEIRIGRSVYKVKQLAEQTPKIEIPKGGGDAVSLDISVLRRAVKFVWFGHDDGGSGDIRVTFGKGKLRVDTADDTRAVLYEQPMKAWKTEKVYRAIVPKKAADALLSCFDADDSVWMRVTRTSIQLYDDQSVISIPLVIDSALASVNVGKTISTWIKKVPKVGVSRVMATDLAQLGEAATTVIADKKKMADAFSVITADAQKMALTTEGDIGSMDSRIPVLAYDAKGKEMKFGVQSKVLRDIAVLAKNTGDELSVEVYGDKLVVLRNNPEENNYKSIFSFTQYKL